MTGNTVLIDGQPQTSIDVRNRGLQYGDGLFETMAVVDGAVRRLQAHLARLRRGCECLGIALPESVLLETEIAALATGRAQAVLKLIVTRGDGGRGYAPPMHASPRRILWLDEWPRHPPHWAQQGVAVRFCRTVLGDQPQLAGIKHLNRLPQVLARSEWTPGEGAAAEGLMLDTHGHVVGGTMSNVFVAKEGRMLTPRLDRCGVAGTMRGAVLEAAAQAGVSCEETTLTRAALLAADEIFLTNALIGIWPVQRVEDQPFTPGPLTRLMQSATRGPNRG